MNNTSTSCGSFITGASVNHKRCTFYEEYCGALPALPLLPFRHVQHLQEVRAGGKKIMSSTKPSGAALTFKPEYRFACMGEEVYRHPPVKYIAVKML